MPVCIYSSHVLVTLLGKKIPGIWLTFLAAIITEGCFFFIMLMIKIMQATFLQGLFEVSLVIIAVAHNYETNLAYCAYTQFRI